MNPSESQPPSPSTRRGWFVVEGLPGTYEGVTRGDLWNGWAVPYFPPHEARRIVTDFVAQPAGPDGEAAGEYDDARTLIRLYEPTSDEWDDFPAVEIDGQQLYPVGTQLWTWEEVPASSASSS